MCTHDPLTSLCFPSGPCLLLSAAALPTKVSPTDVEEGMRVGVDRTKYSVKIPLPPKIDPTVRSGDREREKKKKTKRKEKRHERNVHEGPSR